MYYVTCSKNKMLQHGLPCILLIIATHTFCSVSAAYNYHAVIPERYSANVTWFAPFYSSGGYCSEARSFMVALDRVGFKNFTITQHGDSWNSDFVRVQQEEKEKAIIMKHDPINQSLGYPRISVCHSEPGAWYVPEPRYHTSLCPFTRPNSHLSFFTVGRTMFETDRIPSGWLSRLLYMDEIWVPTEMSRQIFEAEGVPAERLRVVPETINTDIFHPIERHSITFRRNSMPSLHGAPQNVFVFLFVGKFEKRKGIDLLLEAYFREFTAADNVLLLLLTSAYHSSPNFDSMVNNVLREKKVVIKPFPPRYTILTNVKQTALPALYSYAHILVIPSHGEGWGRPHMEAMACGTPVIATNWSGPSVFINEENGYPLSIEGLVNAPDWPGHKWAQPNITELRRLMRHAYSHQEEVKVKGKRAREFILEHYSLEKIGKVLVDEFLRIDRILLEQAKQRKIEL